MSGIFEKAVDSMDRVIAALNEFKTSSDALTAALAAANGGTPAPVDKPKATRTTKAKDEAPANTIDEATLVAKFDEIKGDGTNPDTMKRLKAIIADVGGVASLKELRQLPTKFDAVHAALVALQAETPAADDEDDL